jgi:inner membrane protein
LDSITHIVLGACIGEIILDKNAGRKAMLWGALAQSVPDIDFIAGMWMPVSTELLAHRGITHSFLFGGAISFFLALIAARWHKAEPISLRKWFFFFLIEIGCHLFLDACNNYGIGWFEPFSSTRISFNVIYVADPLFSILPVIAFCFLVFLKTDHKHRLKWARAGVFTAFLYLSFAFVNKSSIDKSVRKFVASTESKPRSYFTTPTLLNNILWFVVVEDSLGYQIGYRSIFDKSDSLDLHHVEKNDHLLKPIGDHMEVMELKKFSQGFYTVENWGDTLVFNDLRFGQTNGWQNPNSRFAFHYYLSHPNDNDLIVQRGRFAGFNPNSAMIMFKRMKNEQP